MNPKSLRSIDLHDHVAIIYESQQSMFDLLAELCRIGIERNERCLIATFEGNEIETHLRRARIDVDSAKACGALIFQDVLDIFPDEPSFDPDGTVALFERMINEAVDQGFSGLRVFNSSYSPAAFGDAEVHLDFVARMGGVVRDNKVVRISLFDLNEQEHDVIINAILSHPIIILRGIVCNNFFYIPPEQLFSPKGGSPELYRLMDNLIDVHHNELSLKESHDELESTNRMLREEINKRKMVEWALLISELRYRNTLDSINEPVIVIDQDYRVTVINKAMEVMGDKLGVNCRCVGRPFLEAFPRLSKQELDEYAQVFKSGETIVSQRIYNPNGIKVLAEVSKVPMKDGDKVTNVTTIIRKLDENEKDA
ncbi:MAG TPA: MEDS domain-containing protein [Methanomassiliicoccales archaeon]